MPNFTISNLSEHCTVQMVDTSFFTVSGHNSEAKPVAVTVFEWAGGIGPPIASGSTVSSAIEDFSRYVLGWGSRSSPSYDDNKFFSGSATSGVIAFSFRITHAGAFDSRDRPLERFAATSARLFDAKLSLEVDTPFEGNTSAARDQLNQKTPLVHCEDPHFAGSWYGGPINLGGRNDNQAFWQLKRIAAKPKSAGGTWLLSLQFLSGDVATYHAKTQANAQFPITLKANGHPGKLFKKWPESVKISRVV